MSAKPLYGTSTPVTVTLNGLVDGGITNSTEFNNTSDLALSKIIEINAVGSNAAETGSITVYAREGLTTGAVETNGNLTILGSVVLNGVIAVRKVIHYDSVAPFFELTFKHNSSGAYALGAAGNSVNALSENIQDV